MNKIIEIIGGMGPIATIDDMYNFALRLIVAGASTLAMACGTAHYFCDNLSILIKNRITIQDTDFCKKNVVGTNL